MPIEQILGDYTAFFQTIVANLNAIAIPITDYSVSHLGYKTATQTVYEEKRSELLKSCDSYLENTHNGRPIAKLHLKNPLALPGNFTAPLIELMPPKLGETYQTGLEHVGIVVGKNFDVFIKEHQPKFTGQQDQGKFCQPYYIDFPDKTRVKFYPHSLEAVLRLEGHELIPVG